ncbi:MAG: hypothetical protein U0838_06010 [Chloroflexota bacterium]
MLPAAVLAALSAQPVPLAQPAPAQHHAGKLHEDKGPVRLGGSGTAGATGVDARVNQLTIPLDQFLRQSGPDAEVDLGRRHERTRSSGSTPRPASSPSRSSTRTTQPVRLIPPDSVARMITAMATYRADVDPAQRAPDRTPLG